MKIFMSFLFALFLAGTVGTAQAQNIAQWQGSYSSVTKRARYTMLVTPGPVGGEVVIALLQETREQTLVQFLLGSVIEADQRSLALKPLLVDKTGENLDAGEQVAAEANLQWNGDYVQSIEVIPQDRTNFIPEILHFDRPATNIKVAFWGAQFRNATLVSKNKKERPKVLQVKERQPGYSYGVIQGNRFEMTVDVNPLAILRAYKIDQDVQRRLDPQITKFAFPVTTDGRPAVILSDISAGLPVSVELFQQDDKNARVK